jgi:hypothetical protein
MKRFALIIVTVLGCTSVTGIIERASSDYLRLEAGNRWTYLKNGTDTIYREVLGDTLIFGDTALIVDLDGSQEYVEIFDEGVLRYERHEAYRGGDEVLLEERYALWIETPLVLDNVWSDTFHTIRAFGADSFVYTHGIEGRVEEIVELTVAGGTYNEVYRVEMTDWIHLEAPDGTQDELEERVDYYAPDVGLVKRLRTFYGPDTLVDSLSLIEFQIGDVVP